MAYSFHNKILLVTGAGSGIGRATARKMASLGASVALCDINATALTETERLCNVPSITAAYDVGSTEHCNAFIASVIEEYGRVDLVFNCAGVNPTSYRLEDTTDEYWDKLVNTNLKGIYNITRASIPHLKSGASFVNVSSIAGLQPTANRAIYCATKYGVIGFSKCMALELGPKGIRTNVVAPGLINTPSNASVVTGEVAVREAEQTVSMGRMGTAEEVADVVAFLFSQEARYMNGSVVEINGGMGALAP